MKYVPGNDVHFGGRTEYSSLAKFYLGNKFYWATQGDCHEELFCDVIALLVLSHCVLTNAFRGT